MKHCFLVTSLIEADRTRSVFDSVERLRQTMFGLINLHLVNPQATIFLIETSTNRFIDIEKLPFVRYVQLEDYSSAACEIVRTHPSKSHGECVLLLEFFKHFRKEILNYDFITKVSGRYVLDQSFNTSKFVPENINKFMFKKAITHPYENLRPNFQEVLSKEILINGNLTGFFTVLFTLGKEKFSVWELLLKIIMQKTDVNQIHRWISVEYLIFYYLYKMDLLRDVMEVDWNFWGWGGEDGIFDKY